MENAIDDDSKRITVWGTESEKVTNSRYGKEVPWIEWLYLTKKRIDKRSECLTRQREMSRGTAYALYLK